MYKRQAEYGLDEKLKKLLATKCSGEHAPDGLKSRLRQSIRQTVLEQAEVTVESGPDGTTVEVRTTRLEQTFWPGEPPGQNAGRSGVRPLAVVRAALLAVATLACPTGHGDLLLPGVPLIRRVSHVVGWGRIGRGRGHTACPR